MKPLFEYAIKQGMRILKLGFGAVFLLVGGLSIFGVPLVGLNVLLVIFLVIRDLRAEKPGSLWRYWGLLGILDLVFFLVVAMFGWPGKALSFVTMITIGWTLAFWLTAAIGATFLYFGFGFRDGARAKG